MNVVRFCRENRYAVYLLTTFLTLAGARGDVSAPEQYLS